MSRRSSFLFSVAMAIMFSAGVITFAHHAVADTTCLNNEVPITDATRATATAAGIPPSQPCWNPNSPYTGQTDGQAKQYLNTLIQTTNKCMPAQQQITGLNSAFAICASQFLQAFQKQYGGTITITRAYFTQQCEAQLCVNNPGCGSLNNNPNPVSNHTRGLAMDVTASAGQATLAKFAQANPQFGVCFPFSSAYGSSFTDNVHMILAGIPGSEPNGPGCSNVKQACSAGNFNPNSIVTPAAVPNSVIAAVPAAPQQQLNTQGCLTSINPIIYNLPGSVYQSQCIAYPPPNASPTTAPIAYAQPAPLQSSPVAAASTPVAAATVTASPAGVLASPTTIASATALPVATTGSSNNPAAQLLQQLMNPTSALQGQAAIQTFLSTSSVSGIYSLVPGQVSLRQGGVATSSFYGTIEYGQQTFEPTTETGQYQYSNTSLSPLQQTLSSISSILSNMLLYLQSSVQKL